MAAIGTALLLRGYSVVEEGKGPGERNRLWGLESTQPLSRFATSGKYTSTSALAETARRRREAAHPMPLLERAKKREGEDQMLHEDP